MRAPFVLGILFSAACVWAAPVSDGEATIQSDSLELQNNGALTVFTGNVILRKGNYLLKADRMVRARDTQVVTARGRIEGTWWAETGEKFVATGDRGRYTPKTETTELWGHSKVTRWQTAVDTVPVVVTAQKFFANQREETVRAVGKVEVVQSTRTRVRCNEATYVQKEKVIHLAGPGGVFIHWEDAQGVSDFKGERGLVVLEPRSARLMDDVKGHVIPL